MSKAAKAIQIREHGGSEKLELVELPIPVPAANEVLVRNHSCGVNFIDIYQREGLYPLTMPAVLGNEAAGEVIGLGAGASGKLKIGQRVAYATTGPGCYCTHKVVPAAKLVTLPDHVDYPTAAASLLRGMTAEYLSRRTWPIAAGCDVLVTAAAGGVGVLLSQWLTRLGGKVIGVVGSEEKRETALANGCEQVIVGYAGLDESVRAICPAGVEVVFDSIGKSTFKASLACLRPRGCLVSYGNASGPVAPFAPLELASAGSLFVTRPTLAHYCATAAQLQSSADSWFNQIERGLALPPLVGMPMADAHKAQDMLASRRLAGLLVIDCLAD